MVTRPVLIIGPLSDVVVEKLTGDYPHKFAKCEPEPMTCNQETLEKGIMSNILVDFRKRGNKFECYTVSAIKEICDRVRTLIVFYIHMNALADSFYYTPFRNERNNPFHYFSVMKSSKN